MSNLSALSEENLNKLLKNYGDVLCDLNADLTGPTVLQLGNKIKDILAELRSRQETPVERPTHTPQQCWIMGKMHRIGGEACHPAAYWDDARKQHYRDGYDERPYSRTPAKEDTGE